MECSSPKLERSGDNSLHLTIPTETLAVDQDDLRELCCGICLNLLSKPRQCRNGHLFCLSCISQYVERTPQCPQCRCSLKDTDLARSLFVEKHIRQLKVHCRYHFTSGDKRTEWAVDPSGCTEIFTVETAATHERVCDFAPVPCSFNSSEIIRKKDLESHELVCAYRPLTCEHCLLPVERSKLDEHLQTCDMVVVTCKTCGAKVKRGEAENHKKNSCPEEVVMCSFQGCETKLLRKLLHDHLKDNAGQHLELLRKNFDRQLSVIEQKFEKEIQAREETIKTLQSELARTELRSEWRIQNWSLMKKKRFLYSEKFEIGGSLWFLGIYPDGDTEDARGYLSAYLFLDPKEVPKPKKISIRCHIRLVNQQHREQNGSMEMDRTLKSFVKEYPIEVSDPLKGWGEKYALDARQLAFPGYVVNDAIKVEAVVHLLDVAYIV
eukprot:TRINITY_DN92_c2_g1_i1.p1 TRINITY_DN92_c2_g1~~TRINITY_DN92_c2_g1_i1.p1  ORF type:complete len:436 (-),score=71.84 TRINITY_DN92_c2_g1_i1:90-1397(-)